MNIRDHARRACGNYFKSGKSGKSGISGKCVTKIFPHEKACVTPKCTFPSPLLRTLSQPIIPISARHAQPSSQTTKSSQHIDRKKSSKALAILFGQSKSNFSRDLHQHGKYVGKILNLVVDTKNSFLMISLNILSEFPAE